MEDAEPGFFILIGELGTFFAKYSKKWKNYNYQALTSLRLIIWRIESNEITLGERSLVIKIKAFVKGWVKFMDD